MRNIKKYIALLLLTAGYQLHAQTPVAVTTNDSLFSADRLSSIPLKDVSDNRTTHLSFTGDTGPLSLFVFLSPECPLCQNYTTVLNKLEKQYAGKVKFYGIIPGKAYSAGEIRTFRAKYKITYPLLMDASFRLSGYLRASITPEVILLNEKGQLVYKGAIDNWLKDLGKMQTKITAHYLEDAIAGYPDQAKIKRTRAVGCLINDQ